MQRLDFIRPISDVSSNGLDGFYLPVEEECADDFLNSSMDVWVAWRLNLRHQIRR